MFSNIKSRYASVKSKLNSFNYKKVTIGLAVVTVAVVTAVVLKDKLCIQSDVSLDAGDSLL